MCHIDLQVSKKWIGSVVDLGAGFGCKSRGARVGQPRRTSGGIGQPNSEFTALSSISQYCNERRDEQRSFTRRHSKTYFYLYKTVGYGGTAVYIRSAGSPVHRTADEKKLGVPATVKWLGGTYGGLRSTGGRIVRVKITIDPLHQLEYCMLFTFTRSSKFRTHFRRAILRRTRLMSPAHQRYTPRISFPRAVCVRFPRAGIFSLISSSSCFSTRLVCS